MFSAVSNLGAGGTQDTALSDTANGVLYGMFALTGLVSGGINNRASLLSDPMTMESDRAEWPRFFFPTHSAWTPPDPIHRLTRLLALHRFIVVVSLHRRSPHSPHSCTSNNLIPHECSSFQTQGTRWFLIFAGGVLGVSAALLWSAQGSIMMSYPLEKDKGKAFGVFWAIFQFGSFIGSLIALAINIRSGKLGSVSTATYLVTPFFPF
jgi:hypothetical protein